MAVPLDADLKPVVNQSVTVMSGLAVVAKVPGTNGAYQVNWDYDYKTYGWQLTFSGGINYNKIIVLY